MLAAFTLAYESQHGWMLSMMSTAFDGFPDDGMPMADVHPFAGVKGNGKTVHERHGIVTVEADPDQPKRKIVRLTDKGCRLRDRHRPLVEAVERERAERHGPEGTAAVRRTLEDVVSRLPSGHVRHLCMEYGKYGFADLGDDVRQLAGDDVRQGDPFEGRAGGWLATAIHTSWRARRRRRRSTSRRAPAHIGERALDRPDDVGDGDRLGRRASQ